MRPATHRIHHVGFTLIELIVVLAIVGLLASIVAPRYVRTVDNAREASLKTSLNVMRDAIDKYAADKGRYPDSLDEMVQLGYLRQVPEDPITGRRDSWQMLPARVDSAVPGQVADVRSGAAGRAQDGRPYSAW
jgi:general secretion pathway protein G